MDQVVEVQSQPDAVSVISVQSSSVDAEETTLIQDLWRRVRSRMGRRPPQGRDANASGGSSPSGDLQGMLNEVSGQVPEEQPGPPDDAPSSSASTAEKCSVCERSFRHRGPTVTCSGCSKKVHKSYCVRYMKLSENLRAGMCNICCDKVEELILDVQEHSVAQGLTWKQESWVKKLAKSHSRGIGLEYQAFRPFNRLQRFLWTALGRGLVVR